MELSIEQKIEKGRAICATYAKGGWTIASCCSHHGVVERTFNNWVKVITEVADAYKEAKETVVESRKGNLKDLAYTSLEKLVAGFEVEEIVQEGRPETNAQGAVTGMKNVRVIKRKKIFAPNVAAVLATLRSVDADFRLGANPDNRDEDQEWVINGKVIKFK
jgi:transposase-like protein